MRMSAVSEISAYRTGQEAGIGPRMSLKCCVTFEKSFTLYDSVSSSVTWEEFGIDAI